jgi:hypothetical protein
LVAASQVFVSVPKSVSCVSAVSVNMFGVHALSVTQAIQLAPLPSTTDRKLVPHVVEVVLGTPVWFEMM